MTFRMSEWSAHNKPDIIRGETGLRELHSKASVLFAPADAPTTSTGDPQMTTYNVPPDSAILVDQASPTFSNSPWATPVSRLNYLAALPTRWTYDIRASRRAGRYHLGLPRTVPLDGYHIIGRLAVKDGAHDEVDGYMNDGNVLIHWARQQRFWICAGALYDYARPNLFPFNAPELTSRFADSTIRPYPVYIDYIEHNPTVAAVQPSGEPDDVLWADTDRVLWADGDGMLWPSPGGATQATPGHDPRPFCNPQTLYGNSAILTTSCRVRRARPGRNPRYGWSETEIEFTGYWSPTRRRQPGDLLPRAL